MNKDVFNPLLCNIVKCVRPFYDIAKNRLNMQFIHGSLTSSLKDDRYIRQELAKHLKLEEFSQNFMLLLLRSRCSTNNYHSLTI